jgi:quinol monooxygenase YgiN
MYGTIMRAKIKAGQLEAFRRYAQESGGPDAAAGWVSSEFAVEDKDPNRIVGIIRFKDKESYVKNANAPRTNDNYNQMMKFFEAPPEWIDVTYVAFQGEPLKEYMTAGARPTS